MFELPNPRSFGTLVLLLFFASSPSLADGLPGKWVEVRSENFVVLSNAGPDTAQEVAHNLEAVRSLFARELPKLTKAKGPRLLVFAPASDASMQRLMPGRQLKDGQAQVTGTFIQFPGLPVILLRADAVQAAESGLGIVYHEYFHHLCSQAGLELPLWLSEGLAEYWGAGTRLTKKFAEVGRPVGVRLLTLQSEGLLPMAEFFAADRSSETYRDGRKRLIIYAQSWAFVHLMLLGDESRTLEKQLRVYWQLIAKGQSSLDAAKTAFGDLEKLQFQLREYSRRKLFPMAKLPLPALPEEASFTTRKISRGEASAYVLRALLDTFPVAEAEELASAIAEDAPALTVSLEARGRLLLGRQEVEEAAKLFEEAGARPDASVMAPYGLAVLRDLQSRLTGSRGEAVQAQIEDLLLKAISLDPEFAPAHARLADLYHRSDQGPDRALAMVRRAQAKAPDQQDYRFLEARILRKFGQNEAAQKIVAAEVASAAAEPSRDLDNEVCWTGSISGFAAEVLPACERAGASLPESGNGIDSRGLAKALTGDFKAARVDFEKALQLSGSSWNDQIKALRREWLAAIEKGEDPFAGMASPLIEDPSLGGIGWWR